MSYASKEHGKKFNEWELQYDADNENIYWPTLTRTENIKGDLIEINKPYSRKDTILSEATFNFKIVCRKNKNNAKIQKLIAYSVDPYIFHGPTDIRFIFNEGQADSISFYSWSIDVIPEENVDAVFRLLSGDAPVNLKIKREYYHYRQPCSYIYSFTLNGEPQLKKLAKILEDRTNLAYNEQKNR